MTKQEKNEIIEVLKGKFTQYNNFYVTDTESLTVAQVTKLRRHCFNKQVEMKVAKNTLIRKALESLDTEKYSGVYDSLHNVTALLFSENPKDPALILSGFRKESKGEKPVLKAAFINGDVFVGDNQLKALTLIKTRNELIGEVIGLLQAPIQRVLGALQNKEAAKADGKVSSVDEDTQGTKAAAPAMPTQEVEKPSSKSIDQAAEAVKPVAKINVPTAKIVKPVVEATAPSVGVEKSRAASIEEVVKPTGETTGPTADIVSPTVESTAPAILVERPEAAPATGDSKPAVDDIAAPDTKAPAAE